MATLDMDEEAVASQIEKIHDEYVSVIQYHNENSFGSVLAIAYLCAMQYYFKPIPGNCRLAEVLPILFSFQSQNIKMSTQH